MGYKTSVVPALIIVFATLYRDDLQNWGHGTYLNPLNITFDPIQDDYEMWSNYTDRLMKEDFKFTGLIEETIINDFSEIDNSMIGHINGLGWGSDEGIAIRKYRMSEELWNSVCEDDAGISEKLYRFDKPMSIQSVSNPTGSVRPIGCVNHGDKKEETYLGSRDGRFPNSSVLHFNSEFVDVSNLTDALKDYQQGQIKTFISSFYSAFGELRVTSPWHAAMVPSLVIQCYGEKEWVFTKPKGVTQYGQRAYNGATIIRGINDDAEHIVVETGRGSVLTFPAYWPHFVMTNEGPSFMYTLRINTGKSKFSLVSTFFRRFLRERMSLINILPKKLGKTAHEQSDEADVHGKCDNMMSREEKFRLWDVLKRVGSTGK